MVWKEITKIALIGTERGELSATLKTELERYGINTAAEPAEVILKGSALFSKIKKAGYQPQKNKIPLPALAPPETQTACTLKSVHHLSLILNGEYKEALPEFLNTLSEVGKGLPAQVLPDILEMGKNKIGAWALLRGVIGQRGEWLAQQNPDWQYILLNVDEEIWETGNKKERLSLLRHLRETNPAKALTLLESTWSVENISDKLDFLQVLDTNLTIAEEAFLEKSLEAKRKEERKIAAKLLSKIPESALVLRMFERIKRFMQKDGGELTILLPDVLEKEMVRDGINPNTKWIKGGVKASRLGQMLAIVPPSFMETYFNQMPAELLALYWHSDWRELLFQATLEATALHNDEKWTDAIFTFWMNTATQYDLSEFININPLLENISTNLFNTIAIMGLESVNDILPENHPVVHLIKLGNHEWQPQLTQAVIQNLQNWMRKTTSLWGGWHYKAILKKAAYHSDPNLWDKFDFGWPRESKIWGTWEQEVDAFLNVLRFRKTMIENLKEK